MKKLQIDLATTKQEAAITVLELNEKIKTLCEREPAPRGQYHHVTAALAPHPGGIPQLHQARSDRQVPAGLAQPGQG